MLLLGNNYRSMSPTNTWKRRSIPQTQTDGQLEDLMITPHSSPTERAKRSTNAMIMEGTMQAPFTTTTRKDSSSRGIYLSANVIATQRRNQWSHHHHHHHHHHPYAWTLTTINLVLACFLGVLHVSAETQQQHQQQHQQQRHDDADDAMWSVWTRLSSGPYYWTTMDKVLFWSLIMIALEILNYLCGKSGGECEDHYIVHCESLYFFGCCFYY
jgi:hypothetical protein